MRGLAIVRTQSAERLCIDCEGAQIARTFAAYANLTRLGPAGDNPRGIGCRDVTHRELLSRASRFRRLLLLRCVSELPARMRSPAISALSLLSQHART
jgi:hypothetical protein